MQSRAAGDAPRAAIYCRLSEEDADKADPWQDSRSIQNQKSMLVRYAVEQGWQIYNIYSDDDYTGSDRGTPPVQPFAGGCAQGLLRHRAVQKPEPLHPRDGAGGKIHPRPVRGMERTLCGLCRQRRHRKSWQQKGQADQRAGERMVSGGYVPEYPHRAGRKAAAGEFVGSFASYGYRKDPQDKHRLLVDEPAAAVVRRIYALYLSGWGASRIAAQLNREQVPNPSAYKSRTTRLSTGAAPPRWQSFERFHGAGHPEKAGVHRNHCAACQREKSATKQATAPLAARAPGRGAGTHAAVIDTETWEAVQRKLAEGGAEQRREGRRDALAGKCRCALCGGKLQSKYGRGENTCGAAPTLWPRSAAGCEHPAGRGRAVCAGGAAGLHGAVSGPGISGAASASAGGCGAQAGNSWQLRAARLEQALARQRACRKTLYEDRVDGAVTAAQFAELSAAFEAEIARLGKELAAAERERGAAAEQAAQCVTAEQLVKKNMPGPMC